MRKIILSITCILILTLSACSSKQKDTDVDFVVEEVVNEMVNAAWGDGMKFPIDQIPQYEELKEFDAAKINEFYGYGGVNIDANRIVMFEVKDEKDLDEVKTIAEKMQENLIRSFEFYLPAPHEVAKNSRVVIKGKYVVFVSHENIDDALEVFEAKFTTK